MADHPDDAVAAIDHEREGVPLRPGNLAIYEKILELSWPGRAQRVEPVAGTSAANAERQRHGCRGNPNLRSFGGPPA
jgi:hypothetical protein